MYFVEKYCIFVELFATVNGQSLLLPLLNKAAGGYGIPSPLCLRSLNKWMMALCALALAGCMMPALAQEEADTTRLVLSLDSARQVAMEHNRTLKNASLDVQKAEASRWQNIAGMLPQVNASLDYQNMLGYEIPFRVEETNMEMRIAMPASGSIGITAAVAFSGAQVVAANLGTIAMRMADITLRQTEQQIGNQVKNIYYSILVMEETIGLLEKNLVNIEKLHATTQRSVDVGVAEQVDADQLSIQVATMKTTISTNRRSLEMLYNSMRLQLGVPADTPLTLSQTIDELINIDNAVALLGEEFVIANNYDYQLLQQSVEQARKQVKLNEWAYGPSLSAYYQYTARTYFGQESGFNMTPPNMIGVTLSVPIFSSGKNFTAVKAAKLDYQKQLNTLADTEESLYIQHSQLRYNLASAFETYDTQKKNVEVTQRVLTNISNKYEHGYASSLEVTDANTNLLTAQSSYVQALLELVNAQIELEELLNK